MGARGREAEAPVGATLPLLVPGLLLVAPASPEAQPQPAQREPILRSGVAGPELVAELEARGAAPVVVAFSVPGLGARAGRAFASESGRAALRAAGDGLAPPERRSRRGRRSA